MTRQGRTFRVFISSTFKDLKAERDALQARVFPSLRRLAERHGCRFQAIDLRWGVPEEAGLDHRAMRICLDELERCRKVSPRPNFLILLGERHGWRPPPAEIPSSEFERLRARATDRELLDAWYHKDENAVPPLHVLRSRTGRYETDDQWWLVEDRLRRTLQAAAEAEGLPDGARLKYTASATEQEIHAGALSVEDAHEHVFAFFREIDGPAAEPFTEPDEEARARQEALKAGLRDWLRGDEGRNVVTYRAQSTGEGITTDHLDALCRDVEQRLAGVIEAEVARLGQVEPVEAEAGAHEEFGIDRARVFVGRQEYLERIDAYLAAEERHPLALWGASGSGKSALVASAVARARQAHPGAVVVERYIGATAASSDIRSLLAGIWQEVSRAYGEETPAPQDYLELASGFRGRLGLATAARPLILFLDALDQLSAADSARSLAWLPGALPEHVRLVVSTLPGECLRALEGKLPDSQRVELTAMSPQEGRELLASWLAGAQRKLTEEQERDVLAKFERCGLPLYLKLAFEEARQWRSYDGLPEGAGGVVGLHADIPGVLGDLFARLEDPKNHGSLLVSRTLGYLAAARAGLTEDELLDVLSRDDDVMSPLEARWELPEKRLPVALWSRLYADLEPYLTQRAADGTSVLSFYHRQVGEAAARAYLSEEDRAARHAALARYFASEELWREVDGRRTPNHRKVSEQPYQETRAGLSEPLARTLTDLDFIEAKCAAGMAHDLVEDYARAGAGRARPGPPVRTAWLHEGRHGVSCPFCLAWSGIEERALGRKLGCPVCGQELQLNRFVIEAPWEPAGPGREVVTAEAAPELALSQEVTDFAEFVRGQAHLLARNAGLTLQQAVNEPPDVAPARAARARLDTGEEHAPFFEWVNRPEERSGCLMTLAGHSDGVSACAFSPDGWRIVSASADRTLKVWDAESGRELATLAGHSDRVRACAFSPDGRRIASASHDRTLKLWDAESGRELATLAGHSSDVGACAFSPDGRRIASGSGDKTIKLWDAVSGREVATLAGHSSYVGACAFSPDGQRIASASGHDRTLKLWDAESGRELATLAGHTGGVWACVFSPDGGRIASASYDMTLKLWDAENGRELATLAGHSSGVTACAFSPDGGRIASASLDWTLKLWDAGSGRELATLARHSDRVHACTFSPDGRLIISASDDKTLNLWDANTDRELATPAGHSDGVKACAFSPDGRRVASGSGDKTIKLWDAVSGREVATLAGHSDWVDACAFSPDGGRIASACRDETLKLWDAESGRELATLAGHSDGVTACAFSPDGRRIASASRDKTLKLWDAESGRELATLAGHSDGVTACAFSPDGGRIASASLDSTLKLWDAESGRELATLAGHFSPSAACVFSPDGRRIASASWDSTLKLWDAESGRELVTLAGHSKMVEACAFSPDGRLIASASLDKTLKLWDSESGILLAEFFPSGARVLAAAMAPSGGILAAGDTAGTLYLLRLHGLESRPPIVTPWRPPCRRRWWRRRPPAFGCPACRAWSEVPTSAPGTELPCPGCGLRVQLNPFHIDADWRPIAKAWRSDPPAGEEPR